MAASEWYHQKMAIVGTIDPTASTTAGAYWTDAIDMDVFERAIFIVAANTIAANTTLTLTVYSDDASATGGMTNAVATSTALTNADDDSQIWLEVDTEDFDVDNRHRYCRGRLVVGGVGGTIDHLACVVLGANCRYHPASAYDLASVAQVANS
jgi:hypothetical protein